MAVATARPRFIPELLTVHAEELAYLWGRRRRSATSAALTLRDLADVNERIEAHTQGLLVAGDALAAFSAPGFAASDRDEVFAAVYPLLRRNDAAAAKQVVTAFAEATAGRLAGLRDALSLVGIERTASAMQKLVDDPDPVRAASAAAVLASHKRLDPAPARLAALAGDANPAAATVAWQVIRLLASSAITIEQSYGNAIKGEHAAVRDAALGAAVWRGEFWAPGVIRRLAESGDPIGIGWLAAVGGPDAAPVLREIFAKPVPAASRARAAARLGHPALIDLVFDDMQSTDALTAASAGEAFMRLTGIDVQGKRTTVPPSDTADEFEREFAADVWLPDVARARAAWDQHNSRWQAGARWCRGCDISSRLAKDDRQRIDLEALTDFGARAALAGERVMPPPPID